MRTPSRYLIALTAALGLFPIVLDSTIVNVAIVPISKALNSDISTVQWIFIGYLLANAAVVTLSGYLGNRFGVKRLFLLGLALFTILSGLCGLAPNLGWLVAGRVFQGIGGGFLMPLGMAMAMQPFAQDERAKASALVGVPLLLGPVVGPIIGGLLIDNTGWQSIFFVNLPVGAIAIVLAWLILPADVDLGDERRSFDYLGLGLSTVGVAAVIYGFKLVSQTDPATRTAIDPEGTIYGWGYWPVWALIGGGLVLLIAFGVHSLRVRTDPVLDLRLFQRREFSTSNVVLWAGSIVSFGVMFLIPVFLQQVRLPHLSALDTGLALVPMGLATVAGIVVGAGFYRKVGARPVAAAGALSLAIALWRMNDLSVATTVADLRPWLIFAGLGVTLIMIPTQTLALEALSGAALNKATSLVNSTKLLAGSIGSAVLVTLFTQQTTMHANTLRAAFLHTLPAGTVPNLHDPHIIAASAQLAAQAGTSGLNDIFTILVWSALGVAILSMILPGRPSAAPTESSPATNLVGSSATVA